MVSPLLPSYAQLDVERSVDAANNAVGSSGPPSSSASAPHACAKDGDDGTSRTVTPDGVAAPAPPAAPPVAAGDGGDCRSKRDRLLEACSFDAESSKRVRLGSFPNSSSVTGQVPPTSRLEADHGDLATQVGEDVGVPRGAFCAALDQLRPSTVPIGAEGTFSSTVRPSHPPRVPLGLTLPRALCPWRSTAGTSFGRSLVKRPPLALPRKPGKFLLGMRLVCLRLFLSCPRGPSPPLSLDGLVPLSLPLRLLDRQRSGVASAPLLGSQGTCCP